MKILLLLREILKEIIKTNGPQKPLTLGWLHDIIKGAIDILEVREREERKRLSEAAKKSLGGI